VGRRPDPCDAPECADGGPYGSGVPDFAGRARFLGVVATVRLQYRGRRTGLRRRGRGDRAALPILPCGLRYRRRSARGELRRPEPGRYDRGAGLAPRLAVLDLTIQLVAAVSAADTE